MNPETLKEIVNVIASLYWTLKEMRDAYGEQDSGVLDEALVVYHKLTGEILDDNPLVFEEEEFP